MKKIKWHILLLLFASCFTVALYGQADTAKKRVVTDSAKSTFVTKMQAFAQKSARSSAADFAADKDAVAQTRIFGQIKAAIRKAKVYVSNGLDTIGAKAQLNKIDQIYNIAGDGVFKNKGTAQTFRNLTATSKIVTELLNQANARKDHLETYHNDLNNFRYDIDSLISLAPLFKFPTDSVALMNYVQQIVVVDKEIHPVDSSLKVATKNVQLLLNQYSLQAIKLQAALEEIELYQKKMAVNTFHREFGDIWQATGYSRPIKDVLIQSQAKGYLTLIYYLQNNIGKLFILLISIITSFVYVRSLKSIYIDQDLLEPNVDGQLIFKYPLLSALIIVVNIFEFFFISPPFVLNVIIWVIVSVSLSLLFRGFIVRYWMNVWLIMLGLFLVAAGDNLILQATRMERWFMLAISLSGAIIGVAACIKGPRAELREKWIVFSIGFMAVLEVISAIANMLGRYNLAKTLMISGLLNVIVAIMFLWTVRLINEGLYLAFNVYTKQDKKLFYLNFDKVGKKAPVLFYIFLVVGWAILFGRNFAGYQYIAKPLQEFFGHDRTLGDYTFSINKILLFIVIMGISVITSKIVSFFASDNHLHANSPNKDAGIGSWLLLIRIAILSIGLFLGIAAAGIPVDRITIVLGALGVGIGFGLQTLVNNLVSGLIIAFEKPVNVGDVVEIEGHTGTIKSIGFRSSVIATTDGADMVMPNGDLLNSHLTNWSLGGNRKRSFILIGIAYDADLQKVKQLLSDILGSDDRITKSPAPVIQYDQFSSSSIDVKVYFWTKHMSDALSTRSDLIVLINGSFRQNGIQIPFPQQDVYLYNTGKQTANDNI